jgi:uncharacterized protein (UPF0335 family)
MTDTNVTQFQQEEKSESDVQRDATAARLKSFVERVERLEEEKAVLAEDIKEVMGEAKASGFDVKILRKVISLRKMDEQKRREEEELLDLYKNAVGMA